MNLLACQEVPSDGQSFLVQVLVLRFGASVARCQLHLAILL